MVCAIDFATALGDRLPANTLGGYGKPCEGQTIGKTADTQIIRSVQ